MSEEERLERAIRALENQRTDLGSSVVDTATAELREKLAQLKTLTAAEERRMVTVLFADVSGFTALSERMDPEEVQALLTRLWRRLDRTITSHRGHIDKHIGDAVMAVWGLLETGPDTAANAVRAGLALQHEIAMFREAERVELSLRVGINTGLSSVSKVESTGEASIIGDAVNVASRLEHAAPLGSVLIGPLTREHVLDLFELGEPQALALKGKREPVQARLVLGERSVTRKAAKTLRGDEAKFVGRREEMKALLRLWQETRDGPMRVAVLSGEAGAGKSRMLAELFLAIVRSGDASDVAHVVTTRDLSDVPFGLIRRLIAKLSGVPEGLTGLSLRDAIALGFRATLGEERGAEATAYVAHLLGFELDESLRGLAHRPEQIRKRAEILLLEHVSLRTQKTPCVVLIDDLHFADRGSLEFLQNMQSCQRLFVLGSVRPPASELSEVLTGATRVELKSLSASESRELARELLTPLVGPPKQTLIDLVVERSGGNPYFAQEIVRWLWERDFASRAPGELPPRIELLLHERLERLPPEARRVLSAASIIGAVGTVAELGALLERDVQRDLETLELAEALVLGGDGWSFRQILLRDVVYEYTLLRERRSQHASYAQWLANVPSANPATVARHFLAAEAPVEAARFLCLSGEAARAADSPDEAVVAFEQALAQLERAAATMTELPLVVRCYEGLAKSRERRAAHGAAVEAFERMLWAANAANDGLSVARAHNGKAWVSSQAGDHIAALAHAEAGAKAALETLKTTERGRHRLAGVELAQALHDQAWALGQLGRAEQALESAERCLLMAIQHRADVQRALALNALGYVQYALLGDLDEGERHMQDALVIYRQVGDVWGIGCLLNNLGCLAYERRQLDVARRFFDEAFVMYQNIGDRGCEIIYLCNVGMTDLAAGNPRAAEEALRRSISMAEAGDGSFAMCEAHRHLSRALDLDGRPEEALVAAERAIGYAADPKGLDAALAWRELAVLLGGRKELRSTLTSGAEECFARSLSLLSEIGLVREQATTQRSWADYEESRGEPARAAELRQSAELLTRKPAQTFNRSTTLRLPR
jgi:class 3 adenylate cyclase/tetratricopeptide (TPR) repeat protein